MSRGMESSKDDRIVRGYQSRLKKAKERYLDHIKQEQAHHETRKAEGWTKPRAIEGWGYYDSPLLNEGTREGLFAPRALETLHGLGGFDAKTLQQWIEKRRKQTGKKVLAIDFLGQGRACVELGADKVIASTFLEYENLFDPDKIEQVNGDALGQDAEDAIRKKVSALRATHPPHALQLVIFRPGAGLEKVRDNIYARKVLYDRLRSAYEMLDDGGLMFLGPISIQGEDIATIREIFKACGVSGIIRGPDTGYGLCIQKDARIAATLPTEADIARKMPEFHQRLWEMDELDVDSVEWGTRYT